MKGSLPKKPLKGYNKEWCRLQDVNKRSWPQTMFLHIGEGLLVKKSDVVAILDAVKIMAEDKNQSFFEGSLGEKRHIGHQVKSLVLVKNRADQSSTMLLMSGIASTTLQKRFHGTIQEMMEIESREMNGKPTKQL